MNILEKVLTIQESAEKFGLSTVTLKQYCRGYTVAAKGKPPRTYPPKFTPTEARVAGKTWLITIDGLRRVFGEKIGKQEENK